MTLRCTSLQYTSGATEEDCIPILEKESGLKAGTGFTVGYSPERINPGDKEHTFTKIKKVVSAQDESTLNIMAEVYESVITAGVYRATSIKVAEAAKVIENTQRDLNIAFVNELALIFDRLNIDTNEVLQTAATKWNFLPFKLGLVEGHCIGVDPYYLTYKAERTGYSSQVILSGRKINNDMGRIIAQQTIKEMIKAGHQIMDSKVTILGLTFKENYPDLRNSKVIDIIDKLKEFGVNVQIHDEYANSEEAEAEYGIKLCDFNCLSQSQALVVAVAHKRYTELSCSEISQLLTNNGVIVDVKCAVRIDAIKSTGLNLWRL